MKELVWILVLYDIQCIFFICELFSAKCWSYFLVWYTRAGARPMTLVFGNVEYKEIQFHFITTFPELFFCDLWNTNLRLCTNAKKKKFYEIKTELKHKNPNLIQKSISIFEILFSKNHWKYFIHVCQILNIFNGEN